MSEIENKYVFYLKLSIQYLHLVESVLSEIIKQGNKQVIISDYQISSEEFSEKTKWSDYNLIEPLIFNFYHGIELLLKGILISKNIKVKTDHKIENLFNDVVEFRNEFSELYNVLKNYVGPNKFLIVPLKIFCNENKITISRYYEVLRYPEDKDASVLFNADQLKRMGDFGVEFFEQLKNHIHILRIESVKYHQSLK